MHPEWDLIIKITAIITRVIPSKIVLKCAGKTSFSNTCSLSNFIVSYIALSNLQFEGFLNYQEICSYDFIVE